jgi:hypothetical protein
MKEILKMLKKDVLGIVKSEMELGTMKETEEFVAKLEKVFSKIAESLEERKEGATDKAVLGSLTLEKVFVKGRTGEMNGKAWKSEDKFVVKGKLK